METVREWATEYEGRGFALARIRPGEKRPTDKGWTEQSFPAEQFSEGDNIGIQSGRLSRDLVCVDIDDFGALTDADAFLPATEMIDGRPGKPRSHRWYRVTNIPPGLTSTAAGSIGGPRTKQFKSADGQMLVEFRGTGSQAVVPPSVWTSSDGKRREQRVWNCFGEPAVVDCQELFDCVVRLAVAHGHVQRELARKGRGRGSKIDDRPLPDRLPIPPGKAVRRARAYVAKIDGAIQGKGGDAQTFRVACVLVVDFGLSQEDALPLLLEYNERCQPPWSKEKLLHKLEMADRKEGPRGRLVRKQLVVVRIRPEDTTVYVGMGCRSAIRSYVDLSSMYAGIVEVANERELSAELAAIDWQGKQVFLTPPSTIATNKREVWGEFFLARLLRMRGATVKSVRLPPLGGRKRVFSQADGSEAIVEPPFHAWQTREHAEAASLRARELDAERRALPRKKGRPRFWKASRFILKYGVTRLSAEVVDRAKRHGITRSSLRRALNTKNYKHL
jgi:hypothetical protein